MIRLPRIHCLKVLSQVKLVMAKKDRRRKSRYNLSWSKSSVIGKNEIKQISVTNNRFFLQPTKTYLITTHSTFPSLDPVPIPATSKQIIEEA